jgi:hypothetical protein
MAAYDALEGFVGSLSEAEKVALRAELKALRAELLAARSEDARVRLVHEFIREAGASHAGVRKG